MLKEVVFGIKTDDEAKNNVKKILKAKTEIKIFQTIKSSQFYQLEREGIVAEATDHKQGFRD